MSKQTFRAFWVEEKGDGFVQSVKEVPYSVLPDHEVSIRVHYSSLNYKDALSAMGNKGVTREYPHIPGIDAAGIIENDRSGNFSAGQKVIVTGYDLGSNTYGGFGEAIKVPADWVVPLPENLSLFQAMQCGTAGFTAMYGIKRLERERIEPQSGKILVTGATGGVGSMAVYFLGSLGYDVIAATGKKEEHEFLKNLGASEVIDRKEITNVGSSALLSRKWKGAIETVGGDMLDAVIRQAGHDGAVACCGNILGDRIESSIYPFILRGVSLLGIDSAICKMPMRLKIWQSISDIGMDNLSDDYSTIISLEELEKEIRKISEGRQSGRVVIRH